MRVARTGAMFAAFVLVCGVRPLAAQTGEVEGLVRSLAGRAIPAATVVLSPPPDTTPLRASETDRLGVFRFVGLAPGTYALRARSLGFGETVRTVIVRPHSVSAAPGVVSTSDYSAAWRAE
ncbi:MAG: carboxypeptidase-like regulatory domain-containing protein [Longimicrobiales bacterium]